MTAVSEELLQAIPRLWRGSRLPSSWHTVPTGFTELDGQLPGGGWPLGSVVELITATLGTGEVRLLLPLMGRLTRSGNHVLFVCPPYHPNAVALHGAGVVPDRLLIVRPERSRDGLWAVEQALRNAACGAVLLWARSGKDLGGTVIRRLQLAAQEGQSILFLYRSAAPRTGSPAALRLELRRAEDGLQLRILKASGTHRRPRISLQMDNW